MVYFVLTRTGYDELIAKFGRAPSPLWVNNGVLAEDEIKELYEVGVDISNFTIDVDPQDASDIAQAVETIEEHHPGEAVWVERVDGL